jgi:glycosyltransferase involved in cell wall biosynthesis
MARKARKIITFYNAVPMPHSVLLQSKLESQRFRVFFWYYKNLTKLYPWSSLKSDSPYHVFRNKMSDFRLLISHILKSDLVIITGWHTKMHLFILFFCKMLRIQTAYWLDVPEKPAKKNLNFYIKKFLLESPDHLLITGETGISNYKKWYGLRGTEFYDFPYLSADFDQKAVSEMNAKRKTEINAGGKIRLFISNRFIKRKGYHIVFSAFEVLSQKRMLDRFEITITGVGEEFENYQEQFASLKAEIRFLGWVPYEDYLNQMLLTDIYLHASLHEPFGIPPCDAMACGKLLIASNAVYSSLDRIENKVSGFVYDADNYMELVGIFDTILANPTLIYDMGRRAKATAQQYDYTYNINQIHQIIAK